MNSMYRKYFTNIIFALLIALSFGCSASESDDDDDDASGSKAFRFVVISDTHTRLPGNPDDADYNPQLNIDNLAGAVERINADYSDAEFVAVTGDLAGALFSKNPDDYGIGEENPAEKFAELIGGLEVPSYPVLGNHDYQESYDAEIGEGITSDDIEAMESVWRKVLGIEPYYSVTVEGIRLIFLNANRGDARTTLCSGCDVEGACTGSFDEEQMNWFESELATGEPAILFFHHPIYTDTDASLFAFDEANFYVVPEDRFYTILESYQSQVLGIFVGHGHVWEADTIYGTVPVFETSSIGDTNGDPDNIHIVDVDPYDLTLTVTIGKSTGNYMNTSFVNPNAAPSAETE